MSVELKWLRFKTDGNLQNRIKKERAMVRWGRVKGGGAKALSQRGYDTEIGTQVKCKCGNGRQLHERH